MLKEEVKAELDFQIEDAVREIRELTKQYNQEKI